jgi:hypothetical protein
MRFLTVPLGVSTLDRLSLHKKRILEKSHIPEGTLSVVFFDNIH